MSLRDRAAVAGVGETAYTRGSGRSGLALSLEASLAAVADAGLSPRDIDGVVPYFPGGGNLSVEFTDDAPDEDHPRFGAWLELRAEDPAAVMRRALGAGLQEVKHPGHPHYFMLPGGQVFTVAPAR